MHCCKKSYSEKDADYYNQFTDGYSPYSDEDLNVILKPIVSSNRKRPKICELGCASGQFSNSLAATLKRQPHFLLGIDIARNALINYPFNKICGSAFGLPLKNNSIDIFCLPAALHHLFPISESMAEINRVLKPKGLFYCLEPNFYHPQRRFFMRYQKIYNFYRKTNDVPIDPDKLKNLLIDLNFKRISIKYLNINFNTPSVLQRVQNYLSSVKKLLKFEKFIMPWFIMTAQKGDTADE